MSAANWKSRCHSSEASDGPARTERRSREGGYSNRSLSLAIIALKRKWRPHGRHFHHGNRLGLGGSPGSAGRGVGLYRRAGRDALQAHRHFHLAGIDRIVLLHRHAGDEILQHRLVGRQAAANTISAVLQKSAAAPGLVRRCSAWAMARVL